MKKSRLRILLALLLASLAIPVALFAGPRGGGGIGGEWILSVDQHCPNDLVCVEWLTDQDMSLLACCLDASAVGSTARSLCPAFREHTPH